MKSIKLLTTALGLAGVMWASTNAAYAYGLNTDVQFGDPLDPDTNPGSYNVNIALVDGTPSLFEVIIKSNGNFNALTPEHDVIAANFVFWDKLDGKGNVLNRNTDTGFGGTTPGGPWTGQAVGPGNGSFLFSTPTFTLSQQGTNTFLGYINLSNSVVVNDFTAVKSVDIRLFNGASELKVANFSGDVPNAPGLTPEGDSAAMLLPALLPLGLVLRRRMAARGAKAANPTVA